MSIEKFVTCDGPQCVKKVRLLDNNTVYPPNTSWFGSLIISQEEILHFCSEECFKEWFKGEYDARSN